LKVSALNPFVAFLQKYQNDPCKFVEQVLKVTPDAWQKELLNQVALSTRKISVRSGHGTGKSTVASWVIIWYFLTKHPCKIVLTAPTSSQLFDALFSEVKSWIRKLPEGLQALLEVTSDRVVLLSAPQDAFISCRTARAETPEAMAGVHSDNVLLVIDEASGIPEKVFEAAAGSMSGESCSTLMLGNPVRTSGSFYESHHRLKSEWYTMHVSCVDSPRVSKEFIKEMAVRYGEDSSAYYVRVLGKFPKIDDETIISLSLVEDAQARDIIMSEHTPRIWGLDIARFGTDSSVLAERQGTVITKIEVWKGKDLMQLTGLVHSKYNNLGPSEQPIEIMVDSIGLGAGVLDRLKELGLPARGINVSESPSMRGQYINLRAELWFRMKEFLEARDCKLPKDESLFSELVSPRYSFSSTGKLKVESKQDMKKRGLPSPDRADAVILTLASEPAMAMFGKKYRTGKITRGIRSIV
jgi:phage terminase large subunit